MTWINDPFWTDTLAIVGKLSTRHISILTPIEWASLDNRYYPIDYGWSLTPEEITGFAIGKDDVDHLPYFLLKTNFKNMTCIFANEVFVIYSSIEEDFQHIQEQSIAQHLPYFIEKQQQFLRGTHWRHDAINPKYPIPSENKEVILIYNANHMGNFGDDLLTASIVKKLAIENFNYGLLVVRPDFVPPPNLSIAAIVFAGGGGIYDFSLIESTSASIHTISQISNICAYFKYAFVAQDFKAPFYIFGLGDQFHFGEFSSINARNFVYKALILAELIHVRDLKTANLLRSLIGEANSHKLIDGTDIAISYLGDRHCKKLTGNKFAPTQKPLIGITGEIFNWDFASTLLNEIDQSNNRLIFIALSSDDVPHYQKLLLLYPNVNIDYIDISRQEIEVGCEIFNKLNFLVTTRFHGLILALSYGIPVLTICYVNDKKDRLITENNINVLKLYATSSAEDIKSVMKSLFSKKEVPQLQLNPLISLKTQKFTDSFPIKTKNGNTDTSIH